MKDRDRREIMENDIEEATGKEDDTGENARASGADGPADPSRKNKNDDGAESRSAVGEEDGESGEEEFEQEDEDNYIRGLFEAVLFLSNDPLPISFFVKNFNVDPAHTKIVLDSLQDEYEERDGGIRLLEISNGFQFVTGARYADQIRRAMGLKKRETLSKGMLETLSIIAYNQPIVLADIDDLRGVSSRMMVANLMKKNLVKPVGRKDLPGRPLAYGTSDEFLRYFGLNKLSDLPKLAEIKEFSMDSEE
jgi:segregation and condensation protein B